jgi:protein-tyrosine phosphatase
MKSRPVCFFGRKVTKAKKPRTRQGGDLAVLDLTAESNAPVAFREHAHYHNLPLLDLVPLKPEHITAALDIIREQRAAGRRVFMHCQLGLQRSALIAAHWLVVVRRKQAKAKLRIVEPAVLI